MGAVVAALVTAAIGLTVTSQAATVQPAKPAKNFYYGSDGQAQAQCGTAATHAMADYFARSKATDNDNAAKYPADCKKTDGSYGGYIGEIGNWDNHLGCRNADGSPYEPAAAEAANADGGVGANGYWMLAGPGRAPAYNKTSDTTDAKNWGREQAQWALSSGFMKYLKENPRQAYVFLDIEHGVSGWSNGWYDIYKKGGCSTTVEATSTAAYNWDTFYAFWVYWDAHSSVKLGVYNDFASADGEGLNGYSWDDIFPGHGLPAKALEWTWDYQDEPNDAYPTDWSSSPYTSFAGSSECDGAWQFTGGYTGKYTIRLDLFNVNAFDHDGCS
jgi:hypothetical protein